MIRLALLQIDVAEVEDHLRASAPNEEGCFLLLRQGAGVEGRRLLAVDPILPPADAWQSQGEGHLTPSPRWISAVISRAIETKAGLMFVHSHPNPGHPVGLSPIDERTTEHLATVIGPILDGPFAAAVVHPEGWAGVLADNDRLLPINSIASVDRTIRFLRPPSHKPTTGAADIPGIDDRQRDALGTIHDLLRELHVGVVGAGGLGSPMAEQLVRMGVGTVTLIDPDVLDTPSNIRRVFGSTAADLHATVPPPKVDVVGRHLDSLQLGDPVLRVHGDVRTESVFRRLLDCDVVLSGTDTHGSRAVINDLASAYLLPVIDVGVQAGAMRNGGLAALAADLRVLTPTTPCLWCRKQISADVIRAENLPPEQREKLKREGYLVGSIGEPAPSVVALTVLGSGLATCALLALLSSEGDVCPPGYLIDGLMGDSTLTQPTEPVPDCRCRSILGAGDTESPPVLAG